MTTIAKLAAILTLDVSDFTGNASKAAAAGDKLKGNLESFGAVGTKALLSTGAAAGAILGYGVKIAADMEQARIGFTTMLGSAEKADSFIRDLQAFAAHTPFEFAGLQEAASKLVAVGVKAEEVIPLMTVLGDATSAVGTGAEGIQRATLALAQMRQKGKVTGEEMLQLVEAGIPAWDALAAKLGTDVVTAQDKVSKGQVNVNDLFAALEGSAGPALQRVKGMMEAQSSTFTGMLSNLKDTVDQQLASLGKPIMEGLKRALPAITDFINRSINMIKPAVDGAAQAIGSFFAALTTGVAANEGARTKVEDFALTIRNSFQWLLDNREVLIGAVVGLGAAWAASMALAAAETIAATWPLMLLVAAVGGAVALGVRLWNLYGDTITDVFNNRVKPVLADVWHNVLEPVANFVRDKWNVAWDAARAVWQWFADHLPEIKASWNNLYEGALKPIFSFIAANQESFKNLAVGLAVVAGAILAVVGVAAVLTAVMTVVAVVIGGMVALAVVGLIIVVQRVIQVLWDWFNTARDAIGGVIDKIEEVVQWFWDLAQNVGSAIADAVRAAWSFYNGVVDMARGVGDKIGEVIGWFFDLPGRISGAVGSLGGTLYNAGRDLLQGLLNGINSAWNWVQDRVRSLAASLPDWVKGPLGIHSPSTVFAALGGNVAEGFALGIVAGHSKVMDATKGLVSAAQLGPVGGGLGGLPPVNAGMFAQPWSSSGPREVKVTMDFSGTTNGTFATAFMSAVRSGEIQIRASQVRA